MWDEGLDPYTISSLLLSSLLSSNPFWENIKLPKKHTESAERIYLICRKLKTY
jgi:hypothetical protein